MEEISVVSLLGRLAVSMAIVLGLLWLAARVARKRGLGNTGGTGGTRIEVLARQGLGRTSSLQLVRVGGRTLVLGVTDSSVSLLGEADPLLLEAEQALAAALPASEARPVPGWGPLLEAVRERTART